MDEIKRKISRYIRKYRRKKSKLFVHTDQKKERGSFFAASSQNNTTYIQGSEQKRNYWKLFFWICFDAGIVLGIILLGWIFYIASEAPELTTIESSSFNQGSVLLDRTGTVNLYTVYGEEDREVVSLENISPHMQDAILAAEDAGFYEHAGVSLTGIARAGINTLQGRATGGSTLSQQLIKMAILDPGKETFLQKIKRKIQEITLTRKLEKKYKKKEILELYLNKAPFGRNAYGIESAAEAYFGKSAKDLTITESAILAGLPQSPSRYSATLYSYIDLTDQEMDALHITDANDFFTRSEEEEDLRNKFRKGLLGDEVYFSGGKNGHLRGRFDFVIQQMREKGFISQQEFEQANEEVKTIQIKKRRSDIKAPHFVFYAEEEAKRILKEKLGEEYTDQSMESGGFKIYTSLDYQLQTQVQDILKKEGIRNAGYKIRNESSLVLDPQTGEILVMAGSRDYYGTYIHPLTGESLSLTEEEMIREMNKIYPNISDKEMLEKVKSLKISGKVNVLTSLRQPGSTFKPITYASAFEFRGLSPATVLMDVKTNFGGDNKEKEYIPRNFDGKFHGPIPIRKSLGNSYNIGAIKSGIIAGLSNVYKMGLRMGITFSKDIDYYGSSISLGSAEIEPLQMGLAFSSFANGGKKIDPISITKIVNANGEIIYQADTSTEKKQIMSEETAFLITDILSDTSGKARPTRWNNNLTIKGHTLAAKTGTSTVRIKDKGDTIAPHDAWVIGYSSQRLAVIWAGNNEGWKENKYGALSQKASGLGNAGPIFKQVMTVAHADLPSVQFPRPAGIKEIGVSKLSGKIPPEDFPSDLIHKEYFNAAHLPEAEDDTLKVISLVDASKKLPNKYTPPRAIKKFTYIELHSYFPGKENWEKPVKEWIEENREALTKKLGVPDVIPYVPEETDDTYGPESADNAPRITIISPANMGIVAPPFINVESDINAENGISSLEYFWDGELITTKNSTPWTTSIHIGDTKIGTVHTLTARVTDRTLYEGETSIQVKIGEDSTPPEVSFIYPSQGSKILAQTLVEVRVHAIDRNSAVSKVEYFLNGKSIQTLHQLPFDFSWTVPELPGDYTLKAIATDKSGNVATTESTFTITAPPAVKDPSDGTPPVISKLEILSPQNRAPVNMNQSISFFIPEDLRREGNTIELHAKKVQGKRITAFSLNGAEVPSSGMVSYSYSFPSEGDYQVYVKVTGESPRASPKITLHVSK